METILSFIVSLNIDILLIILVVVLAYFFSLMSRRVVTRVIRRTIRPQDFKSKRDEQQREDTLISILTTAAHVTIWTAAVLTVLSMIGVNIGPLLAGAGIAGVALGFGAQTMVKDFLAGLFILGENQYRVGDVLQVNQTVSGVVEKISLRMTKLRDLDGNVHYIPNGEITIATNMTMEYAQVVVDVGVSYDSDIDKVEAVIDTVGESIYEDEAWRGIVLEAPYMLRVDSFDDSAITVRIVGKTAPIRQWEVKSEILRRLKKAFDKEGIEIPFPQRVLHTAEPKKSKK